MIRKSSVIVVLITFLFSSVNPLYAGSLFSNLPAPGTPVQLSPTFKPVMLQGIKIDPKNPLHLDFIIDTGDAAPNDQTVRAETLKLVRYFLASLTVPNDQLWVNLSPYEKNRIIPDGLSLTEMGSELLAQDYMLKQLTASLMGPEQAAGKQFWSAIYSKADKQYGSTQIPLDIFNKVWIVPDRATIYEHGGIAVIKESHLKVMLEQDYLSLLKHHVVRNDSSLANDLIRKVVLPQIEQEVNEGRNFAGVRQVNNALILAAWFKQNLQQSLLGQKYANRNKVIGIDLQDRAVKQKIYAQYLQAFKKGVYNYIKEDTDPQTQEVVARKYFLGGYNAGTLRLVDQEASPAQISAAVGGDDLLASIDLAMVADGLAVAENAVQKRLRQIEQNDYLGFPVVAQDKDIPAGIQYDLAFYDQPEFQSNPVRELIRAGRLRAGPDFTGMIKVARDGDGVVVSTDSENDRMGELLVGLLSGDKLAKEFKDWKDNNNRKRLRLLTIHTSGVIARPLDVLKRYGILDLLDSGRPVQMKEIVDHVKNLTIDGTVIKYNTPNPQYIAVVLRALASLGWLNIENQSPSDDMEYGLTPAQAGSLQFTLTPQGMEAVKFADRYAQVADFMPEFSHITGYLFNRPNALELKKGALTLRQLDNLSKQGWDIPSTMEPALADLIKGQLDGYLVINLASALNLYQGSVLRSRFLGINSIIGTILNPNNEDGIWESASLTEVRLKPTIELNKILKRAGYISVEEAIGELPMGYDHKQMTAIVRQAQEKSLLDFFDDNLETSVEKIAQEKGITGNTDELKAAFDIFVNVGFLTFKDGKYKLTQQGLASFDKVLNYGVAVSYRPSYDLAERFLFGDAVAIKRLDDKNRELLVYRLLNVLGSGASHATYFRQVDKIVQTMIEERLKNGEIPPPEQLSAQKPFVLSFADTGSGDGTYLAHVYHVLMSTQYGNLVRQFPDLYKIEMVGVDYYEQAQFATSERLEAEGIEHTVMFGDIGDPKQIVKDVKEALLKKYGENAKLMVVHTRTFLDHNRPWTDVENITQANSRNSQLTGFYGWRGKAIPNNYIEQNLYQHFKAWHDALKAEGQTDLIVIELHTIPWTVAAANVGKTLTVPYDLSHGFSDQFIIENSIYQKTVEEAGFLGISHSLSPDNIKPTVSIDLWRIPATTADHAMTTTVRPVAVVSKPTDRASVASSPFGGINLNPNLGFINIEGDAHGRQLPMEIKALQNIHIRGIEPILLKIVPLNSRQLLDE